MHDRMVSLGNAMFAGDFSNYDGTLNKYVLWKIVDIINRWYNDGSRNARIRTTLWHNIVHSRHIMAGGFVYTFTHGNPSGNPLTVIINSIYQSLIFRMAYIDNGGIASHFSEDVVLQCYGDDGFGAAHPRIRDWFSPAIISKYFTSIGMNWTNESKGEQTNELRPIEQITFLKRAFKYCEITHEWIAPLELASIGKMVNWVRKSPNPSGACADNCRDAIEELGYYDQEFYEECAGRIRTALAAYQVEISVPDWRTLRELGAQSQRKALRDVGRPYM